MAARTGLQAFLLLCHNVCRLLGVWQPSIVGAINATSLTSAQKSEIIAVMGTINNACSTMDLITQKYEL